MKIKIDTDENRICFYGRPDNEMILLVCDTFFPDDNSMKITLKKYVADSMGNVEQVVDTINVEDCRTEFPDDYLYNLTKKRT